MRAASPPVSLTTPRLSLGWPSPRLSPALLSTRASSLLPVPTPQFLFSTLVSRPDLFLKARLTSLLLYLNLDRLRNTSCFTPKGTPVFLLSSSFPELAKPGSFLHWSQTHQTKSCLVCLSPGSWPPSAAASTCWTAHHCSLQDFPLPKAKLPAGPAQPSVTCSLCLLVLSPQLGHT